MIDRDVIVEFIETRKRFLLGIAAAVLIALAFVLGVSLVVSGSSEKQKEERAAAMKKDAFAVADLFYPVEPLTVPGVQLSRTPEPQWNAEDAKRWYTVPDAATMDRLHRAGQNKIDALLESVP